MGDLDDGTDVEAFKNVEKETTDTYTLEQDLQILTQLQKNLDKFKDGNIDDEELKLTKIKIDRIMMKYAKKNMNENKVEKAEEAQNEDPEYIDEENQNSMVRAYVNEKLDETVSNHIDNDAFDDHLIDIVKKLNILKLFTMEAKVDVIVAAVF